jgi:hypothetical protein
MAFSEQMKQRVIELSPGRSSGEVLRVLNREFPEEDLPDERTIRRWRSTDSSNAVTNQGHQEQLADIVDMLLVDIPDGIVCEENATNDELSNTDIEGILEYNTESVCNKYSDWFFYSCFLIHVVNDFPKKYRASNFWEFFHEQPLQLIETLRLLAERKTFNGTCPMCKDW